MQDLPSCCGRAMITSLELGRFLEAKCQKCGDVVYVKKRSVEGNKPVLLDD
ncbi:MAG TPA: hypothetical protein VI979_04190 [archaeon]|nr:hypothetical protein [archaeon]